MGDTIRQTFAVSVTYFLSGGRIGIGRAATAGGGGRRAAGELYFVRGAVCVCRTSARTPCVRFDSSGRRIVPTPADQTHAVMDRGDAFRYGGYIANGGVKPGRS